MVSFSYLFSFKVGSICHMLGVWPQESLTVPVRRYFNVHTTSSQRYGRCIDVETMLCE